MRQHFSFEVGCCGEPIKTSQDILKLGDPLIAQFGGAVILQC
jgi:hypothetical protein